MRVDHEDSHVVDLDQITDFNRNPDRRVLFRSATVISVDPAVGNFARGDILVEGNKFVAVAPDLDDAARNAGKLARVYRPKDIYIGTLVVALSCIDTGTTNVHDLMHKSAFVRARRRRDHRHVRRRNPRHPLRMRDLQRRRICRAGMKWTGPCSASAWKSSNG